jgi:DNA-binding response OmpR family regulator
MCELTSSDALRVLVADDCRDFAGTLACLLRRWGHETLLVHDGPAALRAALWWGPDVALLDIGLPLLDGREVARRIRSEPGRGGMLLWALTGRGSEEDERLSREAGFDLHLVKPFDPEELRGLLARAVCGAV